MPYGGNPGTGTAAERRDAVFLKVGDTNTAHQIFTNAEIDFFLSEAGDDILGAAQRAAHSAAAHFAKLPKVAHGPSSVDPAAIAEHFFKLADQITEEILATCTILVGGISKADVESTEADPDRVPEAFTIGMDDYARGQDEDSTSDNGWSI